MNDRDLVNLLRIGDESAFRSLVDEYQQTVLNCCFKFVRNKETAEDLTQEVFIEVHRSIASFQSKSTLSTWLYRIAITKSLDFLKSLKRQKRTGFLKSLFSGEGDEAHTVPSEEPDPLQVLESEERKRVLSWAVGSLPENQRVAFTLSKFEDLGSKEIAAILNTTDASAQSLIFRAKASLKKKLYDYYRKNL